MRSSLEPLKTRRVGSRCTLNLTKYKRPPIGVLLKLGDRERGACSYRGVGSSHTLDCCSKLRGLSPKALNDEAHFWLNGYVNKQNCCIWSEANPQVYVETPLHPEKLTVWCALWAGGILFQKR
ncbi:hypothetical protein TNCV_3863681 [Trichonephila clavipes]|uniref:Uncharacterized protein n=1 Tax=Trichonephila clavipes TaxID=2585209 RepID=A0A8X6VB43_TRICX|nr:hypothetical protein TNCV_3863681 [Trichonephila clavipes]